MRYVRTLRSLPVRIHRDQRGTISIVSVFTALILAILLGMVMNVGRQVDGKLRMQNAADAAAHSGGVVLARGMNTVVFTNHLLCDVFAVTAFMREARDRNSEASSQKVLDAWAKLAPLFMDSKFPKFVNLGNGLTQAIPDQRKLVETYSQWAAAVSAQVLPMMETILSDELIPKYQHAVLEGFPEVAQQAVTETARRNGLPDTLHRGTMSGALWRTSGMVADGSGDAETRTLPAVDPVNDAVADRDSYMSLARLQRDRLSHRYLRDWNNDAMCFFDAKGKMSQFGSFWRSYTCGYLEKLLHEEYPDRNMPFQIRHDGPDSGTGDCDCDDEPQLVDGTGTQGTASQSSPSPNVSGKNDYIDRDFTFLAVVYWGKVPGFFPKLFTNPIESDPMAYAAVRMYIPRRRLVWAEWTSGGGSGPPFIPIGGVPGDFPPLGGQDPGPGTVDPNVQEHWRVVRQGLPTAWNLLNQSWTCQLVPATQSALATILQTAPPSSNGDSLSLPNLGGLTSDEIQLISPH